MTGSRRSHHEGEQPHGVISRHDVDDSLPWGVVDVEGKVARLPDIEAGEHEALGVNGSVRGEAGHPYQAGMDFVV